MCHKILYVILLGIGCNAPILDMQTATSLLELPGHTNSINSITFSSDGKKIVTRSQDDTKIWSMHKGTVMHMSNNENTEELALFTSYPVTFSTRSDDEIMLQYDQTNLPKTFDQKALGVMLIRMLRSCPWVSYLALSPDYEKLAIGTTNGTVWIWQH